MLDDIMRRALDQLIDRTTLSFHTVMSSIRIEKADFHIVNESDYAIGLAHGMILTGFLSDFKTHNKREPNQEEMIEVSKVLFKRTKELSEAVFKSRYVNRRRLNLWEPNEPESSLWPSCGVIEWFQPTNYMKYPI